METEPRDQDHEDDGDEAGDESAKTPPPLPAEDDDSPLGDTDQHSGADA